MGPAAPRKRSKVSSDTEDEDDEDGSKAPLPTTGAVDEKQILREMWDITCDMPFRLMSIYYDCYYEKRPGRRDYRARLQSKIHARLRLGMKTFLRQGYTIRNQKKKDLNKVYKFMKDKFPDAEFSEQSLREMLIPKLNRSKTNLRKKHQKISKKEVNESIDMLSRAAAQLHKKSVCIENR